MSQKITLLACLVPHTMAKTKKLAKESVVRLTSWTRFHLPREQEWPTWSAGQAGGGHYGPLKGVKGCFMASLGRKVDDPEEAVYIIGEYHLHRNYMKSLP